MRDEERIRRDIELFEKRIGEVKASSVEEEKVIELAKQYCEDGKYYLSKKDFLTAFGCINYAHGLIDGILAMRSKSGELKDPET